MVLLVYKRDTVEVVEFTVAKNGKFLIPKIVYNLYEDALHMTYRLHNSQTLSLYACMRNAGR